VTKKKGINDGAGVKGFFRLNIIDHKNGKEEIVGDSGWCQNQITTDGYAKYIVGPMVADAGSLRVAYAALGTGTAPASSDTGLLGELGSSNVRFAVVATLTGTKSAQYTGSLNSNVYGATAAINNVGLFAVSTTRAGSICAGNTYATSTLQTNQTVNLTYSITFS
jgi:hypothetical protein